MHDIAGIAAAALNVSSSRLQHRVFYAASGMNPLVTGGQIADIVREMVPGEHRNRRNHYTAHGTLLCGIPRRAGCQSCRGATGYRIQYRDIRNGMKEYADRYCEYLESQGHAPAKRAS